MTGWRWIRTAVATCLAFSCVATARAGVGDPQLKTDHPWYPGELAFSTFPRLFATQAELYERVTGERVETDEQKVLASWLWRNTHFAHGEEGRQDLFERSCGDGKNASREYWTGLFSHGFALCGATHSQWCGEMEALLGHGRARVVGVDGHNSFEVFLTGPAYGSGKWVLLDHDLSTVVFDRQGKRLLSIPEIGAELKFFTDPTKNRDHQRGWLVSGLHPDDARGVLAAFRSAEYFSGYAGAPPLVHLRRGEKLRRYFAPGLEDGKTFVFWGRNYNTAGIPGPERSRTWVNQPEKMHGSIDGAGHRDGQVRFANAVFTYDPNFADDTFREGVVASDSESVTFEFQSPYLIGATPPNNKEWGIYDRGGKNGLVVEGKRGSVSISTDQGATWSKPEALQTSVDLTDLVKGNGQYWIRFHAPQSQWPDAAWRWTTKCAANVAVLPRLKDQGTEVTYRATNQALTSAGPRLSQLKPHILAGAVGTPRLTLHLKTPRDEPIVQMYAAAQVASSNPPNPDVKYQIEYSADRGQSWQYIARDWQILRRGQEPDDFWSQSFCWGSATRESDDASNVQIRFRNDSGKPYLRSEAQLLYLVKPRDGVRVTYAWSDAVSDDHTATHRFSAGDMAQTWQIPTAKAVITKWLEMEPVP